MSHDLPIELKRLASLNLTPEQLQEYDVLILPENFDSSDNGKKRDAQDAINLSKQLKEQGLACANSYDLGIEVPTIERRSHDFWFGEIFILKDIVIPIVTGVIYTILAPVIQKKLVKKDSRTPTEAIHTTITISKEDEFAQIDYNGDPETFLKILDALKNKNDEQKIANK